MRNKFLLFILLSLPCAHASMIVFRAPNADSVEYEAFLLSSNKYISPVELNWGASEADEKKLTDLFAQAQSNFLDAVLDEAKQDFRLVVRFARGQHWSAPEQNLILQSYLRWAQLSSEEEEVEKALTESIVATPLATPDPTLYPPPLLEKWNKIKESLKKVEVDLGSLYPRFQTILIDGQKFSLNGALKLELFEGKHLVSLLSTAFRTIKAEVNVGEIADLAKNRTPWVKGDCAKNSISFESNQPMRAFFSQACSFPPNKESLPRLKLAEAEQLVPVSPPPTQESRSLFKNKWFWIGVAAATAGVVALAWPKNDDRGSSAPSAPSGGNAPASGPTNPPSHSQGF